MKNTSNSFPRFASILLATTIIIPSVFSSVPTTTYAAAVTPTVCGTTAPELVTNGGFEAPVVTNPDLWDVFPSGTPGLGWTVEWLPTNPTTFGSSTEPAVANLEIQQNGHFGYQSEEGQQWAELDSDWVGPSAPIDAPASVDIYQDISTIPGDVYQLSFSFSPRADHADADENVLSVDWGSQHVDTITRASVSGTQSEWLPYTYALTATTTTSRLMFSDLGIPDSYGTYLDDVSLCDTLATGTPGGPVVATSTASTTLTVINLVINDNGGTATSSDFTIDITGTNTSTSTFSGSSTGTIITLDAGAYSVSQEASTTASYTTTLSADCSGTLVAGDNKVCTITNTDNDPNSGSGGSSGGSSGGGGGTGEITGVSSGGGSSGGGSGGGSGGFSTGLSCSASSPTGVIGQPFTFTVSGNNGAFTVVSPSTFIGSTTGSTISGSFTSSGPQTITVQNGGAVTSCQVNIVAGQVLGAFDGPGMPTTGGGGNIYVTFGLLLTAIFLGTETTLAILKRSTR